MPVQITRDIVVTGQQPLRAGFSGKTQKPYTLYSVQTEHPVLDDGGTPCELRAFGLITHGEVIECTLEVYPSTNGTRTWTVKPNDRTKMQRPHTNMPKQHVNVSPALQRMQAQPPTPVVSQLASGTFGKAQPTGGIVGLDVRMAEIERKNAALQAQVDDTYAQLSALTCKLDTLGNLLAPEPAPTN